MTTRFAGKTAIVTGSSRGIGLAIATRLVAEGARVCLTARHREALDDAVRELGGPEVAIAVEGRGDDSDVQDACVAQTMSTFGSIDLLVNSLGINPTYGPLVDTTIEAARKILEINCLAALAWTQKAYRASMGQNGGAIVNVSSVAGLRPANGIGMYGASKALLSHLTAQLAVELGPAIRVNAVAPAIVKTRFSADLYQGREAELAEAYPLKRLGVPADIASVVAFLLSQDADWMTGQVLAVDGGQMITGGV